MEEDFMLIKSVADHVFQVCKTPRRSVVCAVGLCKGLLGYVCGFVFLETMLVFSESEIFQFDRDLLGAFGITESRLSLRI